MKERLSPEFSRARTAELPRYLISGALNTAITYVLLLVAMRWLAYLTAYTVVYAFGILLGYWLQSRFVFRVSLRARKAALFPLIGFAQYVVGFGLLWGLVDGIGLSPGWAALVVVGSTIPVGFMLSRFLLTGRLLGASRERNGLMADR